MDMVFGVVLTSNLAYIASSKIKKLALTWQPSLNNIHKKLYKLECELAYSRCPWIIDYRGFAIIRDGTPLKEYGSKNYFPLFERKLCENYFKSVSVREISGSKSQ
jgi:hypothetical protein